MYLQIASENTNGHLGAARATQEGQIERPNTVMLSYREGLKRAIECVACSCEEVLGNKEGQILKPDDRVLVHVSQSALISVIKSFITRIINAAINKMCLRSKREGKETDPSLR